MTTLGIGILLIALIIAAAVFGGSNKKAYHSPEERRQNLVVTTDAPQDFGYKTAWLAVKTNQRAALAAFLGFDKTAKANWQIGLEIANNQGVFFTPRIGDWILVVGWGLNQIDGPEGIKEIEQQLQKCSEEFGETQYFATHRVVDLHLWIKAREGAIKRSYAYLGESRETLRFFGEASPAEKGLNLFNSLSQEAEEESYFQREDLVYPDEEMLMQIAANWSVNPTTLSTREDIVDELGMVAKNKEN
ncbi:MAG: hypothetical protein OIF50_09605 [Flavobacteriaceae bacterium]|nr:hypothetical protein [Flavobacteriaceae bacterium]